MGRTSSCNIKMTHKSDGNPRDEMLSISEASRLLGVNEATLRQWTDEGKIDAFITPGGHRRYSRADLKKFTHASQKSVSVKELAGHIGETTPRHRELGRMSLELARQSADTAGEQHKQLAALGRRLLYLISSYMSETSKRAETMSQAKEAGIGFGQLLASMDIPVTDAVQAFLLHREPILQAATDLMARREPGIRIAESIALANRFMDETLVCMIAAHQQARTGGKRDSIT